MQYRTSTGYLLDSTVASTQTGLLNRRTYVTQVPESFKEVRPYRSTVVDASTSSSCFGAGVTRALKQCWS
jgi:hypothetical protein